MIMFRYLNIIHQHIEKMHQTMLDEKISSLSLANAVVCTFIEETDEKLLNCTPGDQDTCILTCLMDINHYKIGKYNTAATFAEVLHKDTVASFFYFLESNEREINNRLYHLADEELHLSYR
ncbi:hypothetical protein BEL04_06930 [Mucilaginibacter sp. PPCGB 2223]|nr:hypothetical protein BEL04_06930 [Mucilaginibacter sp. PPCGB 2223]